MSDRPATQPTVSAPRKPIATYSSYREAERAVDWLSDQGFAVERVAIVGTGLRYVEQVAGRLTTGRAALAGAGEGAFIGVIFALLFGIFFTGPDFLGLLAYSIVLGLILGAAFGALMHLATGGERDFTSASRTEADQYQVMVDAELADEADRILRAMPAGRP